MPLQCWLGHFSSGCIWVVSSMWTPKTLRIGKVVVNTSFRWHLGAGLMLKDLVHLALWVQVYNKSRLYMDELSKLVWSVLHCRA